MTRAEALRHALAFTLRKVHVRLDEDMRWQLAGEAIDELRRYGKWKELDEEAPNQDAGGEERQRQARGVEREGMRFSRPLGARAFGCQEVATFAMKNHHSLIA